jgi:hypothetical protein
MPKSPLKVGDQVLLNGTMITGRDAAHHYMIENFIKREPPESERQMCETLERILAGNVIYHCGPVVAEEHGKYKFVAAGPTTSIREEPYEHLVIKKFNIKGVIGKAAWARKRSKPAKIQSRLLSRHRRCRNIHRPICERSHRRLQARSRRAGSDVADSRRGFSGGRHHGQPRRQLARRSGSAQKQNWMSCCKHFDENLPMITIQDLENLREYQPTKAARFSVSISIWNARRG